MGTFKKDDLVIFDNRKEKLQGIIVRVDEKLRLPVRAQFTNGSTRSYTLDGRACRHSPITLSLEETKKPPITIFELGDKIEYYNDRLKETLTGQVICDNFVHGSGNDTSYIYPIEVKFDDDKSINFTFTRDGRHVIEENPTLLLKSRKIKIESKFKKGDSVYSIDTMGIKVKGKVIKTDHIHIGNAGYPIVVLWGNGNKTTYTKDGRFIDTNDISLFLDTETKTPEVKTEFQNGDSVIWTRGKLGDLEGTIISLNHYRKIYPILVKFDDGKSICFTSSGQSIENGVIDLIKKQVLTPEPMFKKGDAVVYKESKGSFLHGVVCYVDEDGRSFPVEIELNGFGRRKMSFTADGKYTTSDDQKLFHVKDLKLSKMKEVSKKVNDLKQSLDSSIDENPFVDFTGQPTSLKDVFFHNDGTILNSSLSNPSLKLEVRTDGEEKKVGIKESEGKLFFELDWQFIKQMAERMQSNKENSKYPIWNWKKPMNDKGLEDMKQATMRHLLEVMDNDFEDDGREFGHLEAISTNVMIISHQIKMRKAKEENEKCREMSNEIYNKLFK